MLPRRAALLGPGLVGEAHAHRAEPTVDVEDLTGDARGHAGAQEGGGVADILDRDIAAQWGDTGDVAEHLAKATDAGARERLDRPGRDASDANGAGTYVRGEKANVRSAARL